ncbi:MAG: polyprenyl synthetase family protein [Bacteroidales bacterium]|jgi:geranylgeranyl diphosphate synthase type II|nr:polyprenyl synthetase family protein [Bacteroidales bacterium]
MLSHNQIFDIFNKELDKLYDKSSDVAIQLQSSNLYEPVKYALQQGGKRIRPIMLLLSCEACGGNIIDAIYPAIGLEIFHNFTLVHDDIMDNASVRRGKPTVCNKWNNNIAILSGDTLFALAIKFVTMTRDELIKPILEQFCKTSIEVCEGQQFDMDFETMPNISIYEYIEMIRLKTAVMFASALKIGAMIAGKPLKTQEALYKYGEFVGLAFQIMDDYLDVYGDSNVFGKKTGGDIICCKKSYLYLKAMEVADDEMKLHLRTIYEDTNIDPAKKVKTVVDIFNILNVKEIAIEAISCNKKRAQECLDSAELDTQSKKVIEDYCNELFVRES